MDPLYPAASALVFPFSFSQEMAVISSTTACAAITSHTTSSSNVNSTSGMTGGGAAAESHGGGSTLADKIHGITEKLQALGHHRTESEVSRTRTGKIYTPCDCVLHRDVYVLGWQNCSATRTRLTHFPKSQGRKHAEHGFFYRSKGDIVPAKKNRRFVGNKIKLN